MNGTTTAMPFSSGPTEIEDVLAKFRFCCGLDLVGVDFARRTTERDRKIIYATPYGRKFTRRTILCSSAFRGFDDGFRGHKPIHSIESFRTSNPLEVEWAFSWVEQMLSGRGDPLGFASGHSIPMYCTRFIIGSCFYGKEGEDKFRRYRREHGERIPISIGQ